MLSNLVERQLKIINGVFTSTDGERFSQDSSMPQKNVIWKLRIPGCRINNYLMHIVSFLGFFYLFLIK